MTIAGRALYDYIMGVNTDSVYLYEAQAHLRWHVYSICPEKDYLWFTSTKALRAYIR